MPAPPLRLDRRRLLGWGGALAAAGLVGCTAGPPAEPAPWQQRLRTATPGRPRRIAVLGDSVAFGSGSSSPKPLHSFVGVLRADLDRTYGAGGTGWLLLNQQQWPVTPQNRGWDPRLVVHGPVTKVAAGLFRRTCAALPDGGTDGARAHVELTAEGRTLTTLVLAQPGGRSQQLVSVDGGEPVALRNVVGGGPAPDVQPRGGRVPGHLVSEVDLGSPGTHTVRVWARGGPVHLVALGTTTGTAPYVVDGLAVAGESLETFLGPDDPARESFFGLPFVDTLAPDLLLVELGANDYNAGRPLDAVEADLRRLVARQQATGGDVALCFPPVSSPTLHRAGTPTYTDYTDRWSAVAADVDVGFCDLSRVWGDTFEEASAQQPPRYADLLHPSDAGAADLGTRVRAFLGL
ncbi:GDSL-like Lipase/Acylhydrolase family protein [Friedmanniella luteola]|uniref:GDSL-like Lipase/Acylhydrolase family protein n=1 Tax=Friedmanniella luteola TaxID=546871 RepID=A0A1H1Y0K7_9ACTN|nr:SGNH/GDSL hydrolase family protein [Friedmanniella luteola]SDT15014.1 GDSL-like Lipase/Acylhydrolase family protein [Friedmanniella luteola]